MKEDTEERINQRVDRQLDRLPSLVGEPTSREDHLVLLLTFLNAMLTHAVELGVADEQLVGFVREGIAEARALHGRRFLNRQMRAVS